MSAHSDDAPAARGRKSPPQPGSPSLAPFAEMALVIHAEGSVEQTIDRVLEATVAAIQCRYAGVALLRRDKHLAWAATTDPVIDGIEELQHELGEGPDLDLVSTRRGVMITDMRAETRWPAWAARAAETGIRSMLGIRLYTPKQTVGTLNLYDTEPDHFDLDDEAVGHIMARHAAAALSRARRTENLWHAIDARKRIGQAQGILMERYGLDQDQAFQVLVRYSQSNNLKLHAVAEELIATRTLPGHPGAEAEGEPES